ncbi:MAG: hypothetical protein CFE45_16920 [Burkholderiales bacterium PBB5]|nr:MAG: hypothetical protein CFE45_16920 [Burkholderiales bacterium PBB5]
MLFARTFLVLVHLVLFALALATVLRADWQFLRNRPPSRRRLQRVGRQMTWWFFGLLASGAALVWIDTGFSPERILASQKLLAKLSVVSVMALNGVLLHLWGLAALQRPSGQAPRTATWLALMGAVSTTSWVMASLLGIGKPLTPLLGFEGFMALYGAGLLGAAVVSLAWMRPILVRHLQGPPVLFDTAPGSLPALPPAPRRRHEGRQLAT